MSNTKQTLVSLKDISVGLDSGENIFENINLSVLSSDKIGVIGANGSGKTTLLKIISGLLKPSTGKVQAKGTCYYIPQLEFEIFNNNKTVFEYILKITDDWWNVLEIIEQSFEIKDLEPNQELATLSGGELIKLNLAIALYLQPDLLLLDEPTNHLDLIAIENLVKLLSKFKGALVVVSHNPYFLDRIITTTWELENKKISIHGGNYSSFVEYKTKVKEARQRQYIASKKELKKIKNAIQIENKRAARSKTIGEKLKFERSMPAILRGYLKNKASKSNSKTKERLKKLQQSKESSISKLKPESRMSVYLELKDDSSKKRTLIRTENLSISLNTGRKLIDNANITLTNGERVMLSGRNGTGKTLLAKTLINYEKNVVVTGDRYLAPGTKVVYLTQKYELVHPNLTLIENIKNINPELNYEQTRRQLANFLFLNEEDINKKAELLSGGEVARLAFAMLTSAKIDLLILDEPTNNLDLNTIDSIVESLKGFSGGIVVISHNSDFIFKIKVQKVYTINQGKLKARSLNSINKDEFFKELINELS